MNTAFRKPPDFEHGIGEFRDYFRTIRKNYRDRILSLADITLIEWGNLEFDEINQIPTGQEALVQSVMYDVWVFSNDYHPLLNAHKDHMYELVRLMNEQMMSVCAAFIPNLLNYTIIFSVHIALLEQYTQHGEVRDYKVTGDHLDMAAEIIYDLYEDLVTWLESEIELTQATEARKIKKEAWRKAYASCKVVSVDKKEGDWVRKAELLNIYALENGGISRNSQFLHFKNAKKLFNETHIGVSKFVQWVED